MALKDYFKFFSMEGMDKIDYLVIFKHERPEINNYINLKKAGNWIKYGDTGYRIVCTLPKDKFENFIIEELNITKDDFQIMRTSEFAGFRL